jgi:ferredoxin
VDVVKVIVDRELCEGNARCVRAAPTVFAVGDDDLVQVLIESPGPELREAVERAVELCPRQALSIAPGHDD